MVDPMDTLVKLQEAINGGRLVLRPGGVYPNLGVWMDEPAGRTRVTYARVVSGKVEALAVFGHNGDIDGIPCFQTGYAVVESKRQKGIASDLVSKGIEEMRNASVASGRKGSTWRL